jgi:dTMP kinase
MHILPKVFSFEGIEGCGKSSTIQGVQEILIERGHTVEIFREPGSSKLGESLRTIILDKNQIKTPWTEFFLFLAARQELISTLVLPKLKANPKLIILLDRYHDSSLAYQGAGRLLGIDSLLKVIEAGPLNIWPSFRFYLAIPLELSHERQSQRGNAKDYFEQEEKPFFLRVIAGYEQILAINPQHFIKIDASQELASVINNISKIIEKSL